MLTPPAHRPPSMQTAGKGKRVKREIAIVAAALIIRAAWVVPDEKKQVASVDEVEV